MAPTNMKARASTHESKGLWHPSPSVDYVTEIHFEVLFMGLTFVALALISISDDNIVNNRVVREIIVTPKSEVWSWQQND